MAPPLRVGHTSSPASVLLAAVLVLSGCVGGPPPHTEPTAPIPTNAAGSAKVVFLWPGDNCEAGGYYTVATSSGRFIGNVGRGTRLEADVPEGAFTFVAWNPLREESSTNVTSANVAVMRAEIHAGRTYFVRLAFGEWDEQGPRVRYGGDVAPADRRRGTTYRVCVSSDAALFAVAPGGAEWGELRDWLDALQPVTSRTLASGQAWLDAEPLALPDHRALAERHWLRMSGDARRIATLVPQDGVRVEP